MMHCSKWQLLFVMLLACIGLNLSQFIQNCPNVLAGLLEKDLGLNPASLSIMASSFMVGAALAQIPVGLLTDRFGGRNVYIVLYCLMGFSALAFGLANHFYTATAARFLAGLTLLQVPLMAILAKVVSKQAFGRASSILLTSSNLGIMLAMSPLALASAAFGWRPCLVATGILCLALLPLMYFGIPKTGNPGQPAAGDRQPTSHGLAGLLWHNRNFVWLVVWYGTILGSGYSLVGLWWTSYLTRGCGLTPVQATAILSIAIIVAIPIQPAAAWFSDVLLKSRKKVLIPITILEVGALGAMVLLTGNSSYVAHFATSLILYGFLNTGNPIIFGMINESFPEKVKALMMSIIVLTAYISIALIQTGFGLILEWRELANPGSPEGAYRDAMLFLLVLTAIGLLASILMKETFAVTEGNASDTEAA